MLHHAHVCPLCKHKFETIRNEAFCKSCGSSYPIINGVIPFLLPSPEDKIAHIYISYTRYIKQQTDLVHNYASQKHDFYRIRVVLERLIAAHTCNINLINEIRLMVKHCVSVDAIANYILKSDQQNPSYPIGQLGYLLEHKYLIRDWCGLGDGESELKAINDALITAINKNSLSLAGPILVLGAGLGRIACELARNNSEVHAIDNSLTMAALFEKLRTSDIEVYDINYKNAENENEITLKHTANSVLISNSIKNNVIYTVGDIANLPYPDKYFSLIVSVYFSDVVPFAVLSSEVKRLIKDEGTFVHYGPLEYHFHEQPQMLSLNEFKKGFLEHGFRINYSNKTVHSHCKPIYSGSYKVYTNWVLALTKEKAQVEINGSTVISINRSIRLMQNGSISNDIFLMNLELESYNGRHFTGSSILLDVLKLVDGEKSFDSIINFLSQAYDNVDENFQRHLKGVLIGFANEGIIFLS